MPKLKNKFISKEKKKKFKKGKFKLKGNCKNNLAELFSGILMTRVTQKIELRNPKSHVLSSSAWLWWDE